MEVTRRHSTKTLHIGLDVHKKPIVGAYAPQACGADVVSFGPIGTWRCDIDSLFPQLRAKGTRRVLVYESGPCGYWLFRYLNRKRVICHHTIHAHPTLSEASLEATLAALGQATHI